MEDIRERKTMLLAQRDVQSVVGGGCLQFKIKRAAEPLAQCEPPGFVDTTAERGVNDELHAAAFVEEALSDDRRLRGNSSQSRTTGENVFDRLLGSSIV